MTMHRIFFQHLKEGMRFFGERPSSLVNTLLLSVVYILGIGIVSVLSKLTRKTFLQMNIDEHAPSYWVEIHEKSDEMSRYFRQF